MTADTLVVDTNRVGISYSGGGPLLAVELGIARAFVQAHILPAVIGGASAGAIVGAAHALDIYTGQGIDLAVEQLGHMSNAALKLDPGDFVFRVVREGAHLKAIGDNAPAAAIISKVVARLLNVPALTLGKFGQPLVPGGQPAPLLQVVATDLVGEQPYWFGDDVSLQDALVASSAIPGIFPWRAQSTPTGPLYLVDGGVVDNQPLSKLADRGCGRIYACAVGPSPVRSEPSNLIDNLLRSVNLTMHECSKLEEEALRQRMPAEGRVIHIHPEVTTPLPDFNFTPELVNTVVNQACQLTLGWLAGNPQK